MPLPVGTRARASEELNVTTLPAKPVRTRNSRGRAANAAVLGSAIELFAERGYNGTSLADIAASAQVAKASILYHYRDKDHLWTAAIEALWAEVEAFYAARWPWHLGATREALQAGLELFIEASVTWPAYVRILFIEGATPSWRSEWLVDRYFGRHVAATVEIIRTLQGRGLIGPGDPAHYQAILTSGISTLIAQSAMWSRAFDRPLDDVGSLRAMAMLTFDKLVAHQSDLSVENTGQA